VSAQPAAEKRGFTQKMLGGVETLGNKVPHPALMFFGLCILVILVGSCALWFTSRLRGRLRLVVRVHDRRRC